MNSTAPLVLVLCTGNSCRSHMAEGFLRACAGTAFRVASAGSKPAGYVHPLSIQVMKEVGIDLSGTSLQASERVPWSTGRYRHHRLR